MPWRIYEDMMTFVNVTTCVSNPDSRNAVVMGRVTYTSIPSPHRPLEKRLNIIVSSDFKTDHTEIVCKSFDEAVERAFAEGCENVFIIGGENMYREAIAKQTSGGRIYATEIYGYQNKCERFFPEFNKEEYTIVEQSEMKETTGKRDTPGLKYQFITYEKK
jgi:dihydrofolate reductase